MTIFGGGQEGIPQGLKPDSVAGLNAKAEALAYPRSKGNGKNNGNGKCKNNSKNNSNGNGNRNSNDNSNDNSNSNSNSNDKYNSRSFDSGGKCAAFAQDDTS